MSSLIASANTTSSPPSSSPSINPKAPDPSGAFLWNKKLVVLGGIEPPHQRFGGSRLKAGLWNKKLVVLGGIEPPTSGL